MIITSGQKVLKGIIVMGLYQKNQCGNTDQICFLFSSGNKLGSM